MSFASTNTDEFSLNFENKYYYLPFNKSRYLQRLRSPIIASETNIKYQPILKFNN